MPEPTVDAFLVDPAHPCWSSHSLEYALDQLPGDATERLLAAVLILDDTVASTSPRLTPDLVHFIRDLTLYGHARQVLPIAECSRIDWLLCRFRDSRLPHRALLIALLFDIDNLDRDDRSAVIELVRGTDGDCFLDPSHLRHNGR